MGVEQTTAPYTDAERYQAANDFLNRHPECEVYAQLNMPVIGAFILNNGWSNEALVKFLMVNVAAAQEREKRWKEGWRPVGYDRELDEI